jgi:dihydrofolate reductase
MNRLVFTANTSADGFINDASGSFDWTAPESEVHAFINDIERPIATYLYGRRLWEVMRFWETGGDGPDDSPESRDYAQLWRAARKVVFSRTLQEVDIADTTLQSNFHPAAIAAMKEGADGDISIGGPTLAAAGFAAGLVDECRLIVVPHVAGGGTPWAPRGMQLPLTLVEERRFPGGAVFLRYRV